MTPAFFHASSILRYSVILFCRFLAPSRLSGLMFSSPMNTRLTPARAAFSTKFGSLRQSVSTWMMKLTLNFSTSRRWMIRSRIGSQSLLRAKLSSVMKKARSPCVVRAHDVLDVVGRAAARLAALHIDDGAERALVGAAAAGVERGGAARCTLRALRRHQRDRRAVDPGQVVHEIVERLERVGGRVEQHLVETA